MPATKSARQASVAKAARKPAAAKKQASKAAAAAKTNKAASEAREKFVEAAASRNAQGVQIQEMMTKSLCTIAQLAEKTGYSVGRIQAHVDYEVSKGRSKMNGKKQVVVLSQPVRRAHA